MLFSETNVPYLQTIQGSECIGDSLYKINTNTTNLSSYVMGLQGDVLTVNQAITEQVLDAESVLVRVRELSAQTEAWDSLYTFTNASSSYIFDGYELAVNAIPRTALLSSSSLVGYNGFFNEVSAVNVTTANVNADTIITNFTSSINTAVNSITATGFYYGNGSKLVGIVAPIRVYVRFNGNANNLPEQSQLPTGYIGTNFNISSITKIAIGIYKVNFARSIEDPKYAYFLSSGGGTTPYAACRAPNTNASTYDITILNKRLSDNATVDAEEVSLVVLYPEAR